MRTLFSLIALLFLAGSSFAATTYLGVECNTNGAVVFPTNFFTGNSFGAAGALTNLDTRGWTNNTGIYGNGVGLTNVPVTLPSGVLTNNYSASIVQTNTAQANTYLEFDGQRTTSGSVIEYKTNNSSVFKVGTDGTVTGFNFVGDFSGGNGSCRIAANGYFGWLGGTASFRQWTSGTIVDTGNLALTNVSSGNITAAGTLTATNGVQLMLKPSFTTNFTCTTNLQTYACNGTNQLVTLPNAAYVPNVIYRFAVTNGWAKVIITNATGAQTIRDGTSLSFTQVGIGAPAFFSDGAHWWPAARTKVVMPNAQFATSTNVPITLANTAYPITFDSIANESQGIALGTNGAGAMSVMWITNTGQYMFNPSIVERFSGNHVIRYWFKSNGTNIPNSGTPAQGAAGGTTIRVITVPFKVDVTSPTGYEIWVQSDNTGDDLYSETASGNYPSAPSAIVPVTKISDSWP